MTDQDHQLPLLPLRDVVVYPHMVLPLFVGRERSMEALERAMQDKCRSCWWLRGMRRMTSLA